MLRFVDPQSQYELSLPICHIGNLIVLASDRGGQIAVDRDSVTGTEHRDWGSNERELG